MVIERFIKTYLNLRGIVTRRVYISGITIAILFEGLRNIVLLKARILSDISYIGKQKGEGLQGILNWVSEGFASGNLGFVPVRDSLTFLTLYIAFVVTLKYIRTLLIPQWAGCLLGGITAVFFWFLDLYIYSIYQLVSGAATIGLDNLLLPILLVAGISIIAYLSNCNRKNVLLPSHGQRDVSWLLLVSLIAFVALQIWDVFLGKSVQPSSVWIGDIVIILIFVILYLSIILPKAKMSWSRLPNVWLVLAAYILLEAIYVFLQYKGALSDVGFLVANTLVKLAECSILLFLMILVIPFVTHSEEKDVADKHKPDSPLFRNQVLNLLFSYQGEISSRNYRAALIFIVICVNTSIFPVLQLSMMPVSTNVEPSVYVVGFQPLVCFYVFLVLYSTFVVTFKRVRTKSLPSAVGWIASAITYLMFCSWLLMLFVYAQSCGLVEFSSPKLLMALVTVFLFGVATVIFLSIKSKSEEKEELGDESRFLSPASFLINLFNLFVAVVFIRFVIKVINIDSATFDFINILLVLICFGLLFSLIFKRASDAVISYWWVLGAMFCFALIQVIYYFTGSAIAVLLLEGILLLRLFLVIAPSREH